jgi:hypothetical protein
MPCGSRGLQASSIEKDVAGPVMQLGSRVPKAHACDIVAVVGKGRTCLTSAAMTIKASVTCGQAATV